MRWLDRVHLSRPSRPLAVLLMVPLLLLGAGTGFRFAHASPGDDANAPSVAGASNAVIAHGVSALPAGQIAWQIVQAAAPPLGQSPVKPRMLGFPLAVQDAILITDQATGQQTRLAPWEATFTPGGAVQRRESLANTPATYDQIALVPVAQSQTTSGSSLLFASGQFADPAGPRDLDLVKGHLTQANPTDTLSSGDGGPLVILVLQGQLTVTTDKGVKTPLPAGHAGSYQGTVTLTSQDTSPSGTTFVAGIVGPAIPAAVATPAPTAPIVPPTTAAVTTAPAASGSVTVLISACDGVDPTKATVAELNASCQQPLDGVTVHLDAGGQDQPQQTAAGTITWSNVSPGQISLQEELPTGYAAPAIDCSSVGPGGSLFGGDADTPGHVAHDLQAGEAVTCHFYHGPSTPPTGTVMAIAMSCPAGFDAANTTVRELDAACQAIAVTLHLGVKNRGQDVPQTTSGRATWENVPPSEIFVTEDPPAEQPSPVTVCEYWTHQPDGMNTNQGRLGPDDTNGNQVAFSLQPNQVLSCWFIHVAASTGTPAVPVATATGGGD